MERFAEMIPVEMRNEVDFQNRLKIQNTTIRACQAVVLDTLEEYILIEKEFETMVEQYKANELSYNHNNKDFMEKIKNLQELSNRKVIQILVPP